MDVNSILAGLAGGLGGAAQGINVIQDDRLRQAQQRLQQQQQDLQVDQAKRRAVMEARQMLSGGMTVSPEQINSFSQYPEFLSGIQKQDDGSFMVQKSKQEMLIEAQIAEHEREVREKQKDQEAREQIEAMGAGYFDLPDAEKLALAIRTGDPKFPTQTPQQALTYNTALEKQKISAQSAADVARIRAQGAVDSANTRAMMSRLSTEQRNQLTYEDAVKILMSDKDMLGQAKYKMGSPEFNQAVEFLMQQSKMGSMTGSPSGGQKWSNLQRTQ